MQNTKTFGYVRVSTTQQNTDRQVEEMQKLGIAERDIFTDMQSGKDFERVQYQALRTHLRTGDTLYIKSLDRFGRDKEAILNEWQYLTKEVGADIIVLDMPLLDTTKYKNVSGLETLITDLVLQLLSFFAEEERKRIRERQKEGVASAMKKGKSFGRPQMQFPPQWEQIYTQWDNEEITAVQAFTQLGISKSAFYTLVKRYINQ